VQGTVLWHCQSYSLRSDLLCTENTHRTPIWRIHSIESKKQLHLWCAFSGALLLVTRKLPSSTLCWQLLCKTLTLSHHPSVLTASHRAPWHTHNSVLHPYYSQSLGLPAAAQSVHHGIIWLYGLQFAALCNIWINAHPNTTTEVGHKTMLLAGTGSWQVQLQSVL